MKNTPLRIAIIGAGPVGMMAALFLQRLGMEVHLIEKYTTRLDSSRSIGIHAPSITLFHELGLSEELLSKAQQIHLGQVHQKNDVIGILSFSELDHPFPMVCTLQQNRCEVLLEKACENQNIAIHRTCELISINQHEDKVECFIRDGSEGRIMEFDLILGADGVKSRVRDEVEIPFVRRDLPDFYAMADFSDSVDDARSARLYLHPDGIIESFPLPDHQRRWVVRFDQAVNFEKAEGIIEAVAKRLGIDLPHETHYFSHFRPYTIQSKKLVDHRVALIGDAAQAVSPIGGQGMNTGWLQTKILFNSLSRIDDPSEVPLAFKNYEKKALKIGRLALQQSLRNTWMGRGNGYGLKVQLAKWMAKPIFSKKAARIFSMQWLEDKVNT